MCVIRKCKNTLRGAQVVRNGGVFCLIPWVLLFTEGGTWSSFSHVGGVTCLWVSHDRPGAKDALWQVLHLLAGLWVGVARERGDETWEHF